MGSPSYLETFQSDELKKRGQRLSEKLASCELCPRRCKVNRLADERGFCRTGRRAVFSSYGSHFGEEGPLVGSGGSGTIFFTHCNLLCRFCQNYDISHEGVGQEISPEGLARIMLQLQRKGCHNINFVSPTHVVAQIVESLPMAIAGGLHVPLVYNTGGYDLPETLRDLEGIVDIYMPDLKFASGTVAQECAEAPDYPDVVREALLEMHRQVGDLLMNEAGVAEQGLLVRHLIMPEGLAGSDELLRWLSEKVSKNTYLNIMDQYRPCGEAYRHPSLGRRITREEFDAALLLAQRHGLHRLDRRRAFPMISQQRGPIVSGRRVRLLCSHVERMCVFCGGEAVKEG
jgi:putative pyruvate formate lyase activating enzyme